VGNYIGLRIPRPVLKFDEELYKEKIREVLDSKARMKRKNAPVEEGDEVVVKFCCYDENNEIIQGLHDDSRSVIVGHGKMFKEFEDALIGKEKGDSFSANMTVPLGHYLHPGKQARFDITVLAVFGRVLPAITDDFVENLGIKGLETVEDFEKLTRVFVMETQRNKVEEALRKEVMDQLIETSEFEIDDKEVSVRVMNMAAEFYSQLLSEGITMEEHLANQNITYDQLLANIRKRALYRMKYNSVIKKIAELENISATAKEVKQEVAKEAENFELSYDDFVSASRNGYEGLKKDVIKKKVVEFIISKIDFIEN